MMLASETCYYWVRLVDMTLQVRPPGPLTDFYSENVPLVEFTYLVFTRMPHESYCSRLRSLLLYLCDVFQTLINSLVC